MGSYLSSMIFADFSHAELKRLFFQESLRALRAFIIIPELSENSESMKSATAAEWPLVTS